MGPGTRTLVVLAALLAGHGPAGWQCPAGGEGAGGDRSGSAFRRLERVGTIGGALAPKSIAHSGTGMFLAQNMMYRHTVTVYDRSFRLVATIPDSVRPATLGIPDFPGTYRGGPVEAAFTSDGALAYVSNYRILGPGFQRSGSDTCGRLEGDRSWLYRINMAKLAVDRIYEVGAVPKSVAVTPDDRLVLVANWCSYDLSVVDVGRGREVARVYLGRHPRGIAIHPSGSEAYVAMMGRGEIARVDLRSFQVTGRVEGVGAGPRHVVLSPEGDTLYVSLNGEGRVAKVDLTRNRVLAKVHTGLGPRSLAIAEDGGALYVVNYHSNTLTKVRTSDMVVVQTIRAPENPVGITLDRATARVWVSSYSGWIAIYEDR